jgi:ubiquinone/menaquinone biosynthesis C-methylase UbiE
MYFSGSPYNISWNTGKLACIFSTMTHDKPSADLIKRFASKGVFPHQMAFTLLIPMRNIFLSPKQLIRRLDLKENHDVLEVGPGPGYFSTKIAGILTTGRLTLADIQQEMLDKARKRIDRKGITNVDYYLCDGNKFILPDESYDIIFLVTVIGEIENKVNYINEFYRLLKSNGLLSISELKGDPDKMTPQEIKELVKNAGFTFEKIFGTSNNYTINFRKQPVFNTWNK